MSHSDSDSQAIPEEPNKSPRPVQNTKSGNMDMFIRTSRNTRSARSQSIAEPPRVQVGSMVPPSNFSIPELDLDNCTNDSTTSFNYSRQYQSLRDTRHMEFNSSVRRLSDNRRVRRINVSGSLLNQIQVMSNSPSNSTRITSAGLLREEKNNSPEKEDFDFRM